MFGLTKEKRDFLSPEINSKGIVNSEIMFDLSVLKLVNEGGNVRAYWKVAGQGYIRMGIVVSPSK